MTGPSQRVVAEETKLAKWRRLPRPVRRAVAQQIGIALLLVLPMMVAVFTIPDFWRRLGLGAVSGAGARMRSGGVGVLAALAVFSFLPLFAIVWGSIRANRLRERVRAAGGALCPECCYPLSSVESDTCPECGFAGGVEAARRARKDAGMGSW